MNFSVKEAYEYNHRMWTGKGDRCTTIGDFLGRIPSLDLIHPSRDETILDAGCGAGFCTRRIARMGGKKVYGCDRAETMLSQAIKHEKEEVLGINYQLADITKLPYSEETFDTVVCIAVLIHSSPQECLAFFREALRVLKPGGMLIVSTMHEALYKLGSANRTGQSSWAQYRPLENKWLAWLKDKNILWSKSRQFEEIYRDADGNLFVSPVWSHSMNLLMQLMKKAGFGMMNSQEQYVTEDVLKACNQTGKVGYPAFQQVIAWKAKKRR